MKPVFEFDQKEGNHFDFEYYATTGCDRYFRVVCSNSLANLKRYIRENTRWTIAWIVPKTGSFSYGQSVVDEYPYCPRR